MSRVVYFEICAEDSQRAMTFYTDVFGWSVKKWGGAEPYWLCTTGREEAGINGGIINRLDGEGPSSLNLPAHRSGTINSIDVKSVDDTLAKIIEYGGAVVMPKMTISEIGYIAYCKDTEGNTFGVYQSDSQA